MTLIDFVATGDVWAGEWLRRYQAIAQDVPYREVRTRKRRKLKGSARKATD